MYESIRQAKIRVRWQLREVFKITQWKSGCVYRTKSLGLISCTPEYETFLRGNKNLIVGSISTKLSRLLNS